jgi:hypothetical protein
MPWPKPEVPTAAKFRFYLLVVLFWDFLDFRDGDIRRRHGGQTGLQFGAGTAFLQIPHFDLHFQFARFEAGAGWWISLKGGLRLVKRAYGHYESGDNSKGEMSQNAHKDGISGPFDDGFAGDPGFFSWMIHHSPIPKVTFLMPAPAQAFITSMTRS